MLYLLPEAPTRLVGRGDHYIYHDYMDHLIGTVMIPTAEGHEYIRVNDVRGSGWMLDKIWLVALKEVI